MVIMPCTDDSSAAVEGQRTEAWDLCLKIFHSSSAQPVYVFIDSASKLPIDEESAAIDKYYSRQRSSEEMPDSRALLYKHTRDVLEDRNIHRYLTCTSTPVRQTVRGLPFTRNELSCWVISA